MRGRHIPARMRCRLIPARANNVAAPFAPQVLPWKAKGELCNPSYNAYSELGVKDNDENLLGDVVATLVAAIIGLAITGYAS